MDASRSAPIGVLTFHRCINYGSYWQARCLVEGLIARGHNAVLLDYQSSRIDRAEWRVALRPAQGFWGEREDRKLYAEKTRKFFAAFETLPLSRPFPLDEPEKAGSFDLVVVGSDEVFNLRHPWFGGETVFYGEGLRTKRRASYAASFGNQSYELDQPWAERLRNFDDVAVRDANSAGIVSKALGLEPVMVLDPVLQFPEIIEPAPVPERPSYIALYGHGLPDWFAQKVRAFADRTGRQIVSIGYRNWWADESWIDASPAEFAGFIAAADAVVTNFFHGCVFAMVNNKPFATAPSDYRSNKVRDLVGALDAQSHLVTEANADEDYDRLLGTMLNPKIGTRIATLRQSSESYLDAILA